MELCRKRENQQTVPAAIDYIKIVVGQFAPQGEPQAGVGSIFNSLRALIGLLEKPFAFQHPVEIIELLDASQFKRERLGRLALLFAPSRLVARTARIAILARYCHSRLSE